MSLKTFAREALLAATFSLAGLSSATAGDLPSIAGLHLGMTLAEASAVLKKAGMTQVPTSDLPSKDGEMKMPDGPSGKGMSLGTFSLFKSSSPDHSDFVMLAQFAHPTGPMQGDDPVALLDFAREFRKKPADMAGTKFFIQKRFGADATCGPTRLTPQFEDVTYYYDAQWQELTTGGAKCLGASSALTGFPASNDNMLSVATISKLMKGSVSLPDYIAQITLFSGNEGKKVRGLDVLLMDMSEFKTQAVGRYESHLRDTKQKALKDTAKSLDGL